MISLYTLFETYEAHHYAVLARKFANAGRFGLALVVGTTLLIGAV